MAELSQTLVLAKCFDKLIFYLHERWCKKQWTCSIAKSGNIIYIYISLYQQVNQLARNASNECRNTMRYFVQQSWRNCSLLQMSRTGLIWRIDAWGNNKPASTEASLLSCVSKNGTRRKVQFTTLNSTGHLHSYRHSVFLWKTMSVLGCKAKRGNKNTSYRVCLMNLYRALISNVLKSGV